MKTAYLVAIIGLTFIQPAFSQNPKKVTKAPLPATDSTRKQVNPDLSLYIPQPIGWTSDFVQLFSTSEIKILDSLIDDYEKKTTVEFAIATVDSSIMRGNDLESYALAMARAWGIGKRETNNGILILIAPDIRRIRIENGYGIERVLSDEETKAIIDTIIIPYFKESRYFDGTKEGILAIIKKIEENGLH